MKTATRPDDLVILGQLLQEGLQSKLSPIVPIQVQCLLQEKILVVLVQHRARVEPDRKQIFEYLEQTILAEHRSVSDRVKIYLRVTGEKQPYATSSFEVEPLSESTSTATPIEEVPNPSGHLSSPTTEPTGSNSVETEFTQSTGVPPTDAAFPHPWDGPIPESNAESNAEPAPEVSPEEQPDPATSWVKAKLNRSMLPLLVACAGLSVVAFFSSLYVLTRPCAIGSCKAISEARELSQKSSKTLQQPQSGKDVLEAQQQLTEAMEILDSIPSWSRYRAEAQELLKAYQVQAERVDEMVSGLKTAARASYKSENPPHPAAKWIEIQNLWREAIAQLEKLPTQSNLQPLAQQKIKEYKTKLGETNQRLAKEREARGYINAAKEAALIAEARQGVAQSLAHWQLVYVTWEMAFKRLKQIPQGTTAYQEAQQLSALYMPKMASARNRKTEEQIATNAYNQGLRLAERAQTSQASSQWSTAVTHWRNALTYVKQVPKNSFYYGKAQLLVSSYTGSLKQAQAQLQLALKLQQARSDLNQTCFGKGRVCDYTIKNDVIKVRLTPSYTQMVRQSAISAKVRGDSNAQAGIVNHVLTLGEALEAISDNARIRLEVYASDGALIQTHIPGM